VDSVLGFVGDVADAITCAIIAETTHKEPSVEIFVAKWLPFLYFWRMRRPGAALLALLLQITLLLWPIASFWAMAQAVRAQEDAKWFPLMRRDF
jgi:hypothetical protein